MKVCLRAAIARRASAAVNTSQSSSNKDRGTLQPPMAPLLPRPAPNLPWPTRLRVPHRPFHHKRSDLTRSPRPKNNCLLCLHQWSRHHKDTKRALPRNWLIHPWARALTRSRLNRARHQCCDQASATCIIYCKRGKNHPHPRTPPSTTIRIGLRKFRM